MSEDRKSLQKLTSWKEIAGYLHVAVRTAQAWESRKGLPVVHMNGKKGRVIADPEELDRWKQSVSHRNPWFSNLRSFKIYAALLSALLLIAVAYVSIHLTKDFRSNSPARSHLEQQPLVVVDHSEKDPLQKNASKTDKTSAGRRTDSATDRKITFQDVDGDGEMETILDYSPVNSRSGPKISQGVTEKRERVGIWRRFLHQLLKVPPPQNIRRFHAPFRAGTASARQHRRPHRKSISEY